MPMQGLTTPAALLSIRLSDNGHGHGKIEQILGVLKHGMPTTFAFALGLRLSSKLHVLGRQVPTGMPQKGLRFRDLRGETLAFEKHIAIISCDSEASHPCLKRTPAKGVW